MTVLRPKTALMLVKLQDLARPKRQKSQMGGFHKGGYPIAGWFISWKIPIYQWMFILWKIPIYQWMNRDGEQGYPDFRKDSNPILKQLEDPKIHATTILPIEGPGPR